MTSAVSIQLPDWLAREVRRLAEEDEVSVDQFVATALAEKLSALKTADSLEARARKGDRARFLAALDKAPDVEPDASDRIE